MLRTGNLYNKHMRLSVASILAIVMMLASKDARSINMDGKLNVISRASVDISLELVKETLLLPSGAAGSLTDTGMNELTRDRENLPRSLMRDLRATGLASFAVCMPYGDAVVDLQQGNGNSDEPVVALSSAQASVVDDMPDLLKATASLTMTALGNEGSEGNSQDSGPVTQGAIVLPTTTGRHLKVALKVENSSILVQANCESSMNVSLALPSTGALAAQEAFLGHLGLLIRPE